MNEQARIIRDFLVEHGAANVRVVHKSKHPRIVFKWNGAERSYVIPGTPGDTLRGGRNAISDIRHLLGLVQSVKRVGERRSRRSAAVARSVSCPTITAREDWTPQLLAFLPPDELRRRLDRCFVLLWREKMRSVGADSLLTVGR